MKQVSVIIPVFNEEKSLVPLFEELQKNLQHPETTFEVIFVNDGSTDGTLSILMRLRNEDSRVKVIDFSRNFGKEAATSAGYYHATGDAVIAIDADLQHPPHLIPEFIRRWEAGNEVIIGVRTNNASDSLFKRLGSFFFYKIIDSISDTHIVPKATDFRLLDRQVVDALNQLTERNRMTRGLIDWLGFKRDYVYFEAPDRQHGTASYSTWKLIKLATESFIAHSLIPLRLAGYLGVLITFLSGILGAVMFADRFIVSFGLNFSGPAILANINLFLVGIVLVSLGLMSFYLGQVYHETQNRPLYVIRSQNRK